ncbi:MAG: DUF2065 domain-containing protein [Proteobacteria bacterium]|nr:DUF2065 domain-containing protein [Pseudomonadota bacterium]
MMEAFGLKYFLSVLGLVFVIEGIPYFLSPGGIKKWVAIVLVMPERNVRFIGFLFMLTGLFVLYLGLRVVK